MRTQFAPKAISEFSGLRPLSYIASIDVAELKIDRYGKKVIRVLYYKLITDKVANFLLIYLTHDGLVTDFDLVDD